MHLCLEEEGQIPLLPPLINTPILKENFKDGGLMEGTIPCHR